MTEEQKNPELEESKIELKITVDKDQIEIEQNASKELYLNTISLYITELEAVKQKALSELYPKIKGSCKEKDIEKNKMVR